MSALRQPANALHAALAKVSPGTPLREGIDRIVRAKMGALVVLGDGPEVLAICSGGFLLDAPFSPQRLSELAKMDGAIILDADGTRIARANVHLVPDPTVPTHETGTRHRTAERVARSLDVPVVSASEEMGVIHVYAGGTKHQLQDIGRLLDRANQALQTLERYKVRLDDALMALTAAEVEDIVTVRDVATVMQRADMVRRIAAEIETMIVELGVDARLLRLQLDEISSGLDGELDLVLADYPHIAGDYATSGVDGDAPASPRGLRLLSRVPRLTPEMSSAVVGRFGELVRLQRATVAAIAETPGIDLLRATAIKETLDRLTESTILDQYS
jgi:diadenylate cyclase